VMFLGCVHRVSDMMLGLWIILMFGSGIPSLYIWGLIWLCVVEVSDRWSLARICQTPSRYGKSLPFLLLGEHPRLIAGLQWYESMIYIAVIQVLSTPIASCLKRK